MFTYYKLFTLIILLLSIFILSACDNSPKVHESWVVPPAGVVYDDSTIYAKVKTALLADSDVKDSSIDVKVKNGEVILSGVVNNQDQIDRVNLHTWTVDGVKKVDNKITLKGASAVASD